VIISDKIKFHNDRISLKYSKKSSHSKITLVINWTLMLKAWLYAIIDQEKLTNE